MTPSVFLIVTRTLVRNVIRTLVRNVIRTLVRKTYKSSPTIWRTKVRVTIIKLKLTLLDKTANFNAYFNLNQTIKYDSIKQNNTHHWTCILGIYVL